LCPSYIASPSHHHAGTTNPSPNTIVQPVIPAMGIDVTLSPSISASLGLEEPSSTDRLSRMLQIDHHQIREQCLSRRYPKNAHSESSACSPRSDGKNRELPFLDVHE
jgi:hypothetical protein